MCLQTAIAGLAQPGRALHVTIATVPFHILYVVLNLIVHLI